VKALGVNLRPLPPPSPDEIAADREEIRKRERRGDDLVRDASASAQEVDQLLKLYLRSREAIGRRNDGAAS
jgi:hypothetical protein